MSKQMRVEIAVKLLTLNLVLRLGFHTPFQSIKDIAGELRYEYKEVYLGVIEPILAYRWAFGANPFFSRSRKVLGNQSWLALGIGWYKYTTQVFEE